MKDKFKARLFITLIAILFLPCVQQTLALFPNGRLYGTFFLSPDLKFSSDAWINGDYQVSAQKYVNDHIGFRPFIIKANNQVDFSLFSKFHSEKIVMGKNNCFFTDGFINSYTGKDVALFSSVADNKLAMLRAIQDTLSKLGTSLILVHAADKAFYYPEYLPEKYLVHCILPTAFDLCKRKADSLGINQVDFNTWLASMKNKSKEKLYPIEGFHWSTYGALLAADSLIRYIERLRHIQMLHPVWSKIERTRAARFYDDDISQGLNLLFPTSNELFSYPVVTYQGASSAVRPRMIYIGDSYFFPWIHEGVMDYVNSDWQMWYYFREVWERYNQQDMPKKPIAESDWVGAMEHTDCIVIMYTAQNLPKLGNGFIERAYAHFYPYSPRK